MRFAGLFVPLITPFTARGEIASEPLEALAHSVLDAGAAGLVVLGTTGEPATLSESERRHVVDIAARVCTERNAQLIIGAGSNATAASMTMLTELDHRAAAALTVVPYYTRPSEQGIVEHFRRLAAASPVPLIIYNVPYRTGTTLSVDTLVRLAQLPNVAGFKHSVGAIDDATMTFMSAVSGQVSVLAGDDTLAGPLSALGARGAILAGANIAPRQYLELLTAWRAGPGAHARALHHELLPLSRALFAEPNPVVIKAVLAAHGRIPTAQVRAPLLEASPEAVDAALAGLTASLPVSDSA